VASSSIISFPHPIETRNARPVLSAFSPAPASTLRRNGLRLVPASSEPAASQSKSNRSNSQAQANRIVAQVEREIALQANRRHHAQINGHTSAPHPSAIVYTLPVPEAETPAGVARRLFAALLSFARPA